jgi:cupin superfamily acireductone dioxygenase involved in methionine salvage
MVPPGLYHRFHPGDDKLTHALRWFKDLPEWRAFYKKDEPHESIESLLKKYRKEEVSPATA